jgi:hypothetical protein
MISPKEAATRYCLFKAEVEGSVQVGEAKPFKDIHVVFYLEGPIKEKSSRKPTSLRNTVPFLNIRANSNNSL